VSSEVVSRRATYDAAACQRFLLAS